jgi:hypothetical protein
VTYETPQATPPVGRWARLSRWQKAGLLTAAFLLPCCGGLTVLGALAGDPADPADTGAPADDKAAAVGGLPAADQPAPGVPAEKATTAPITTAPTTTAPITTAPTTTAPTTTAPPVAPVTTTSAAVRRPVVVTRAVTETRKIAFGTRRVEDPDLAKGSTETRTKGVAGVRTLTYRVTVTDGVQTARTLVRERVTRKPVTKVIAIGTRVDEPEPTRGCDPNYGGCVPIASDVDCAGGSGNGPAYVEGPVEVIGDDRYDLDRDGDGVGCD